MLNSNKMLKQKLLPLKGFRDYYPSDMAFQKWLYEKIQKVSESFGFQEYNGPMVEPLSLYAAKSGEELVKKQSYTFEGKSGETLALRPEMTPTLARMIALKEQELTFPVKWYTYGPRFRYEAPQKGRGREFFQWDIDILGTDSSEADAEIIAVAASFYKELGLTPSEVIIKINDREYMTDALSKINIRSNVLKDVFKIIDKRKKVNEEEFETMLDELKITKETIAGLYELLENKDGYKESKRLTEIFNYLEKFGLEKYVVFDPSIVRGLDYYTRTVFEGWDVKGEFRSIWGGGRYDNLISDVGSKRKIPGVGFAMGNMVLEEILKDNGKYPKLEINKTKVLVTVFSPDLLLQSIKVANELRGKGINTELYPDPEMKLDKQLKYADKKEIPWVVIIGDKEAAKNKISTKNMSTAEQINLIDLNALIDLIKS